MKRWTAFILVLIMLLASTVSAHAYTYYWFIGGVWYSYTVEEDEVPAEEAEASEEEEVRSSKKPGWQLPTTWKPDRVLKNFPTKVIKDVSKIQKKYKGTWIGWLGLVSNKGSNLRTKPKTGRAYKGTQLHADTTVYVYFNFFDSTGREWYYATTAGGKHGYLVASLIQLIPME